MTITMSKNASLVLNLVAVALGMLMLTYASVPLYRIFCEMTGYGGTTQRAAAAPGVVLAAAPVTVTFNADIAPNLPWEFKPGQKSVTVKPGQQTLAYFTAKNLSDRPVKGRAVYNVIPPIAGAYFVKIECFCFTEQTLQAHASVNMPVSFYVDPAIARDPETRDIRTITLSYTFFASEKN